MIKHHRTPGLKRAISELAVSSSVPHMAINLTRMCDNQMKNSETEGHVKGTAGHTLEHGNAAQQLDALVCARLWEGVEEGGVEDGRRIGREGGYDLQTMDICYFLLLQEQWE